MSMNGHDNNGGGDGLVPTLIDGELRIRDIDLAVRLGLARPADIRELITRHRKRLNGFSVLRMLRKTSGASGGRPADEYYLTRNQAMFITTQSGTTTALDITAEIVKRFDAYERGDIAAGSGRQIGLRPDDLLIRALRHVEETTALISALTTELGRLRPIAKAYEQLAGSTGLHTFTQAAQLLKIPRNFLIDDVMSPDWMYRQNGDWVGRHCAIEACVVDLKPRTYSDWHGGFITRAQLMVTPRGVTELAKDPRVIRKRMQGKPT